MKVAIFGATGVVGRAAVEELAAHAAVVAVARRPVDVAGVTHVPLDLLEERADGIAFDGTTHVVYAALQESAELAAGWFDRDLMHRNLRMFRNAVEPLVGPSLEHVTLLQGAKAYGLHLGRQPVPAKERAPRDDHENFYFLQEDALREVLGAWTILRPQVVYGASFGSPMNLLPAIGVLAALERERRRPLRFPGGGQGIQEAVDARLLARAIAWAATAPTARNEIFNVTNGDVFDWHEVWPVLGEVLDVEVADPDPQRLAETMPPRADEWAAVVDRHGLRSPRSMAAFVGNSWQYADMLFAGARPVPALLSTVKIRQAGFGDCIDTEDMFREWFTRLRSRRLLP